jgi:nucleoside-diphosphate-sugar epimerase
MKIAVTGATSDFGAAIIPSLLADQRVEQVIGLGRRPPRMTDPRLTAVHMDIRSPRLAGVLAGCDVVIHLAFVVEEVRDKAYTREVNINGSRNVIDTCARTGVGHLVVASSANAYGVAELPRPVDEDVFPEGSPDHYYFHHKAEVEHYAEWWMRRHPAGMPIALLRAPYVIGPDFSNDGIDALSGPLLAMPAARRAAYQMIDQADLADAFVRAIEHRLAGPWNLAPAGWVTVPELAAMHGQRLVDLPSRPARLAADALYAARLLPFSGQWMTSGDAPMDGRRFRERTGWQPSMTAHEAAACMLLLAGRPLMRADHAPRRYPACEAALRPATALLGTWIAHDPDLAALTGGRGGLADALQAVQHVQVVVDRQAVHLEIHPAERPRATVLALAGPGLHARCLSPLGAALARDGVRTVLIDPPGHGLSTGRRGHTPRTALDRTLRAALQHVAGTPGGPVHLLCARPPSVSPSRRASAARLLAGAVPNATIGILPLLRELDAVIPRHLDRLLRGTDDPLTVRRLSVHTAAQLLLDRSRTGLLAVDNRIEVPGAGLGLARGGLGAARAAVLAAVGRAPASTVHRQGTPV